jgi:hypothetical protein
VKNAFVKDVLDTESHRALKPFWRWRSREALLLTMNLGINSFAIWDDIAFTCGSSEEACYSLWRQTTTHTGILLVHKYFNKGLGYCETLNYHIWIPCSYGSPPFTRWGYRKELAYCVLEYKIRWRLRHLLGRDPELPPLAGLGSSSSACSQMYLAPSYTKNPKTTNRL